MNNMDLIERQMAIETICKVCSMEEDYHKCDGYSETSTWCDELVALRALPSAQSETSLMTVKATLESEEIERIIHKIKDAPVMVLSSAQSERPRGEWIDTETSYVDGVRQTCRCSVCRQISPRPLGDFCRWCGADMRG